MKNLTLRNIIYKELNIVILLSIISCFKIESIAQNSCLVHEYASHNMEITNKSYSYQIKKKSLSSMDTSFYKGKVILKSYNRGRKSKKMQYSLHDYTMNFDFILSEDQAVYNPKNYKAETKFISKRKKIKRFIEGNAVLTDAVIWHNGALNRYLSLRDICTKASDYGIEIKETERNNDQITFSILIEPSKVIKSGIMHFTFNIYSKYLESYKSEFVDEFGRMQFIKVTYSWNHGSAVQEAESITYDYQLMSLKDVQLFDSDANTVLPFDRKSLENGVIVYLWHSGCRPCIETLLKIDSDLLPKIEKRGLKFVAINPYDFQNEKGVTSSAQKILNRIGNPSWSYFTTSDYRPANSNYMPQIFLYEQDLQFVKEGGSIQELLKYKK